MAGLDGNNGVNDSVPSTGQQPSNIWRAGYGQVAPGAIVAADNSQPVEQDGQVQWRANYGQVAPGAIAAADNTAQPVDQSGQVQWRANYGQVAPGAIAAANGTSAAEIQQQQQPATSWRPAYNNVAPIFVADGSQPSPNDQRNLQPTPIYQPGSAPQRTSYPGSNTPIYTAPQYDTTTGQPTAGNGAPYTPPYDLPPVRTTTGGGVVPNGGAAYNPGGGAAYNPGGNGTGNSGWPQQGRQPAPGEVGSGNPTSNTGSSTDSSAPTDTAPTVPIGIFSASVTGGIGGVVGGAFFPKVANKLAEQITHSAPTATGAGWLEENGWAAKVFPKAWMSKAADLQGQAAAKAGDLGAGGMLNKAAVGWQNNFQPQFMARTDLQKLLDTNTTALKAFDGKDLAALPEAEAAQLAKLNATQAVLAKPGVAGAAAELNPNLFTEAGKAPISKLIADGNADATLADHAANLGKAFPEAAATAGKTPFLERPAVSDFMKGAAFFGGTIAADHLVGSVLGSQNGAFHLDTIAIPEAFFLGDSWKQRAIYGAAAVIGSNVIDKIMPASEHQTISRIFAPNAVDGVTMGAAFTLPAEDPRLRAMMIGGAWGFGRLRNMTGGEAAVTTGLGAGLTAGAMYVGKINPELGVGLLAAEGGAFVLSRLFHGSGK